VCALVQEGYLPLHYAAENNAELQVVTALLEAYPADRKAKTLLIQPLHCTSGKQASLEVISALVQKHPAAALTSN